VNLVPGRLYSFSGSGFGSLDSGDSPSIWSLATFSGAGDARRILAGGQVCDFTPPTTASRCTITIAATFRAAAGEASVRLSHVGGSNTFLGADRLSLEELNDFSEDDGAFLLP